MKKLSIQQAEILAGRFRALNELGPSEPIEAKTLLRKLQISIMYRPLSSTSFGISCKSPSNKMFMLINSNSTRGRQHFTIAHELYHLYFDENPTPHMCSGATTMEEKNSDLFASVLLLPREGVYAMLSTDEILQHDVKLATILRIEQLFQVSRSMLLIRLKDIGVISENKRQELQMIPVKESAMNYGYDKSLYESGNDGVFIGDFGEKARLLFETGKISEGHYTELLSMISNGREKD